MTDIFEHEHERPADHDTVAVAQALPDDAVVRFLRAEGALEPGTITAAVRRVMDGQLPDA